MPGAQCPRHEFILANSVQLPATTVGASRAGSSAAASPPKYASRFAFGPEWRIVVGHTVQRSNLFDFAILSSACAKRRYSHR